MVNGQWSMIHGRLRRLARRGSFFVLHCSLFALASCAIPGEQALPDHVDDAKADLVERIKDNPDDIDAHADLLRMQLKSGDGEGAQGTVTHVLKHNERDYRAHLLDAQFNRWQLNLLGTEKSLRRARDCAPDRLEPCVALAGLYNQANLYAEEIKVRQAALALAPPELRPEFQLDLSLCQWQARVDPGMAIDPKDSAIPAFVRARALIMYAEMNLDKGDGEAAAGHVSAALRLDPENVGILQFAARAVSVLEKPDALGALFDEVLAGKDRAEMRWTALFGHWMLAVRKAAEQKSDPLGESTENWRKRLDAMEPGHPDVATRHYQLLKLDPSKADEAAAMAAALKELGLGEPAAPSSLDSVLSLWRTEDALRTGAPTVALAQVAKLEAAESKLEGLRMMRIMAQFTACNFAPCLAEIDRWLAESDEKDEMLLSTRWVILLKQGQPAPVLQEITTYKVQSNAGKWFEAVATFHTYRQP